MSSPDLSIPGNRVNQLRIDAAAQRSANTPLQQLVRLQGDATFATKMQAHATARGAHELIGIADSQRSIALSQKEMAGSQASIAQSLSNELPKISEAVVEVAQGVSDLVEIAEQTSKSMNNIHGGLEEISQHLDSANDLHAQILKKDNLQASIEESIFQLGEDADRITEIESVGNREIECYFSAISIKEDVSNSGLGSSMIRGIENKKFFTENVRKLDRVIKSLASNSAVQEALDWIAKQDAAEAEKRRLKQEEQAARLHADKELRDQELEMRAERLIKSAERLDEIEVLIKSRKVQVIPVFIILSIIIFGILAILSMFFVLVPPMFLGTILTLTALIGSIFVTKYFVKILSMPLFDVMVFRSGKSDATLKKSRFSELLRRKESIKNFVRDELDELS